MTGSSSGSAAPSAPSTVAAAGGVPDHAAYLARKYFGELDGLRTFAIAMVVWNHSGSGDYFFGWGLGVKLFFTISGFLITTLLLREQARTGTISLHAFHVRRVLRIFPLYFAVLGLYVVLVLLTERDTARGQQFFHNLPYFLTFTSNLFIDFDGSRIIFYFAWSLAAQEQFYLLWPSFLRFSRRWWVPVAVLGVVLVVAAVTREAVLRGALNGDPLLVRIFSRMEPSLGFGALAAYVLHRPGGFRRVAPLVGNAWSAPLVVALALLQVVVPSIPETVPRIGMMLLVMTCVVRPRNVLAPVLDDPRVRYVGTVSYGIYLMHMLAVNVARRVVPDGSRLAIFALAFPATIVLAGLSFKYFETPVMNLKRYLLPAGATRPAPGTPAS